MTDLKLISLAEIADRLGGISKYTLKERIKEAGIHGPRPAREMMFTERDYRQLVEHMRQRRAGGLYADTPEAKAAVRKIKAMKTRRLNKSMQARLVNLEQK